MSYKVIITKSIHYQLLFKFMRETYSKDPLLQSYYKVMNDDNKFLNFRHYSGRTGFEWLKDARIFIVAGIRVW
jgi:hypothetical protein